MFSDQAKVESQGSAAKETSLQSSDWDFFIRIEESLPPATKNQRKEMKSCMTANLLKEGIKHNAALREHRISLTSVSSVEGTPLPDVDVIFERFKGDVRLPPNSGILADSPVSQQVGS